MSNKRYGRQTEMRCVNFENCICLLVGLREMVEEEGGSVANKWIVGGIPLSQLKNCSGWGGGT